MNKDDWHYSELLGLARAKLPLEEAEDVVQNVYVNFLKNKERFNFGFPILYHMLKFEILEAFRRRKKHPIRENLTDHPKMITWNDGQFKHDLPIYLNYKPKENLTYYKLAKLKPTEFTQETSCIIWLAKEKRKNGFRERFKLKKYG